jgi:hypothetical protein
MLVIGGQIADVTAERRIAGIATSFRRRILR